MVVLSTLVMVGTAIIPSAAHADPVFPFPPRTKVVVPCAQLGPIDWWFGNQPPYARSGVRYLIVSTTETFDVAYGRVNINNTDVPIDGNWTASESRTVSLTSSITLTTEGGPAKPTEVALSVSLATGIQTTVTRTTTIGVGGIARIPPHTRMLGEYGLESLDVVMDVQTVAMWQDMQTCEYLEGNVQRHTAHVPTINEGWRYS